VWQLHFQPPCPVTRPDSSATPIGNLVGSRDTVDAENSSMHAQQLKKFVVDGASTVVQLVTQVFLPHLCFHSHIYIDAISILFFYSTSGDLNEASAVTLTFTWKMLMPTHLLLLKCQTLISVSSRSVSQTENVEHYESNRGCIGTLIRHLEHKMWVFYHYEPS